MNEVILDDKMFLEKAKKVLGDYFGLNLNMVTRQQVVWDASKAMMRGLFVQQNATQKKLKEKRKTAILDAILEKELVKKPKKESVN